MSHQNARSAGLQLAVRLTTATMLALATATLVIVLQERLHAQTTFQATNVSTPNPQGFFSAPDDFPGPGWQNHVVCKDRTGIVNDHTLPDGAFLKRWTFFRIDAAAAISGLCWMYVNGELWPEPETRTLSAVTIQELRPSTQTGNSAIYPNAHNQSLDSRIPGDTSGPVASLFYELGEYRYTFKSVMPPTNCTLPTESNPVYKRINSVACQPYWLLWGTNPNLVTMHAPLGDVDLYIDDPDMWNRLVGDPVTNPGPLTLATRDWNSQITGLNIQPTTVNCGSERNCIALTKGYSGGGCAAITPGIPNSSTGEWTSNGVLALRDDYAEKSDGRLRRSIGHELGHALGLDHDACDEPDRIMAIINSCDATAPGGTQVPTNQDVQATRSTFGNQVQRVCGF
jgi:hypothetical protein